MIRNERTFPLNSFFTCLHPAKIFRIVPSFSLIFNIQSITISLNGIAACKLNMKIIQILFITLIVYCLYNEASSVRGSIRRSAVNLNDSDEDDHDNDENGDDNNNNDDDNDDDDDDDDNNDKKNAIEIDASKEQLPIASIKSRAIAMDRDLCRILSRYHPHYPRCYNYCEKLGHWMGMCVRNSCHCYS
ncbi:uncharacterized protein ACN427_011466 [Glossina fuscipes fuscipes]